ncbi:MAG TPA: hypothetical protein VJ692_14020, partial [Nitrospiraceae bacterium]|nr:hypothetical protein [Nitrospiraceae bacterium]
MKSHTVSHITYWIILLLTCLHQEACSTIAEHRVIAESALGRVSLERLSTRGTTAMFSGPLKSFQATHPKIVPAPTIARVLRGIRVDPSPQDPGPVPLFSPEEIAFLAPPISSAFSQASPNERVRFQVGSVESREGTLFIDHSVLHFTLSRFRGAGEMRESKAKSLALFYVPAAAERGAEVRQSWMIIEPDFPALAIDYEILAQLPDSPQASLADSSSDQSAAPPHDGAPLPRPARQAAPVAHATGVDPRLDEEM